MKSLQETYGPNTRCFGCGPANEKGLHIRSFPKGDEVVATWTAEPHHDDAHRTRGSGTWKYCFT